MKFQGGLQNPHPSKSVHNIIQDMKICMLCTELITQNHKCSWQTTPVISRELKNIGKKCKKKKKRKEKKKKTGSADINVTNSLKNSLLNSFLEKYLRIKQIWEYLFCSTFMAATKAKNLKSWEYSQTWENSETWVYFLWLRTKVW